MLTEKAKSDEKTMAEIDLASEVHVMESPLISPRRSGPVAVLTAIAMAT